MLLLMRILCYKIKGMINNPKKQIIDYIKEYIDLDFIFSVQISMKKAESNFRKKFNECLKWT